MCVLSIKVPIQKKSGNLFNDPRICLCLCIYMSYSHIHIHNTNISGNIFNNNDELQ